MQVIDAPARAGFDWIRQSFALFAAQPAAWISLLSCWLILTLAVALIIPMVGAPVAWLLQPGLFAGFVIAARDQAAGQPVKLAYLFAGFRFNGRALIMLGSILLLTEISVKYLLEFAGLPGAEQALPADGSFDFQKFARANAELLRGREWLVFLGFALVMLTKAVFWFALPLLALHPMRVSHAIRWSFYAFIGNFLPMLLFGIAMMTLFILAAMPLLLGLMVAMPLYAVTHYTSYKSVFRTD